MSIYLDEAGFFRYIASVTLRRAKSSQLSLFIYLYLIVSVLTVFTSNDIIILSFTPFICYLAKSADIDPIPLLFTEFVAANTWSMALIIGNPTNVYLATSAGVDFIGYVSVMLLPTLFGGVTAFAVLFLLFRKRLSKKLTIHDENVKIEDKPALILGLVHLGLCTVLLTVSSYIGIEMWLITFLFALSLFISTLILKLCRHYKHVSKPDTLIKCVRRMPWELIPFVLSMFVLVLAMNNAGITEKISSLFGNADTILRYGVSSFLTANLINNIPMSVLFSSVIGNAASEIAVPAVFSSVIGSNICAFFTPIGALAGIMWSGILKEHNVKFSFLTFIRYGAILSIPTLTAALFGLFIRLL